MTNGFVLEFGHLVIGSYLEFGIWILGFQFLFGSGYDGLGLNESSSIGVDILIQHKGEPWEGFQFHST